MAKGIFITGTDTGVGKTVVAAGIVGALRSNSYNACYFKPVLSGAGCQDGRLSPGDTLFVKQFAGLAEDNQNITPYIFQTPVSPHLASEIENRPVDTGIIKAKYEGLKAKYDYIVAEGCGGLAVPLRRDGYMLSDLISDLGMSCLLVARATLGTVNHTLLSVNYAQSRGLRIKGIIVSGYGGGICEADNLKIIQHLSGLPVLAVLPLLPGVDVEELRSGPAADIFPNPEFPQHIISFMDVLG
jgi:dethiobiotin synthetase